MVVDCLDLVRLFLVLFLIKVFDLSSAAGALSWLLVLLKLLAIPSAFSLPQWLLMRRQFQKAGWWWIVARPLAWLTGFALITLSDRLDPVSDLFGLCPMTYRVCGT
jgi:hypothetical protein